MGRVPRRGALVALALRAARCEEAAAPCTRAVFRLELDASVAKSEREAMFASWSLVSAADAEVSGDDGVLLDRDGDWAGTTSEVCAEDGAFELYVAPRATAWACDARGPQRRKKKTRRRGMK